MTESNTHLKPGRLHFFQGLESICRSLTADFFRCEMSHVEFLEARQARVFASRAWVRSTTTARIEALAYLRAPVDIAHSTGRIVWRHRINDQWVAGYRDGIDIARSAHVWASSGKVFYRSVVMPDGRTIEQISSAISK